MVRPPNSPLSDIGFFANPAARNPGKKSGVCRKLEWSHPENPYGQAKTGFHGPNQAA